MAKKIYSPRQCANPFCKKMFVPKRSDSHYCKFGCYAFVKNRKHKVKAFNKVSDDLTCIGCGETDLDCLVMNHIHNNGGKERKIHGGGYNFRTAIFHDKVSVNGLELLCASCNTKLLALQKYLPHDTIINMRRVEKGLPPIDFSKSKEDKP